MKKYLLFLISTSLLFFSGCSSSTSWAFQFVNYNGVNYILTDEEVSEEEIEEKIGEVQQYLETEQDSLDLSSNIYPKGTEIYSIKGIKVEEHIAVKDKEGKIVKLDADND
ncbi:hypothetical protein ACWE42_24300 [Sutcliffiella cohnii]